MVLLIMGMRWWMSNQVHKQLDYHVWNWSDQNASVNRYWLMVLSQQKFCTKAHALTHSVAHKHTHTHTHTHERSRIHTQTTLMIAPCQMMTFSIGHNYTKHSLSCFGSNRMTIVSGPHKYLTFCIWIFPCFFVEFLTGRRQPGRKGKQFMDSTENCEFLIHLCIVHCE